MKVEHLAANLLLIAVLCQEAVAQDRPFLGVWELVARTSPQGIADPDPRELLVFTDVGIYMRLELPPDRPKMDNPDAELSLDELRDRYRGVVAFHGTYFIEGDLLKADIVAHSNPSREGVMATRRIKIEGDTLTVSSPTDPNFPAVNRYRRVSNVAGLYSGQK